MGTEAEQIYKTLPFKKQEDEKNLDILLNLTHISYRKKMLSTSVLNFT